MRWWVLVCGPLLVVAVPRFDPTAILRGVLIPSDAAPGSIIYRLRASDTQFDYPLKFELDDKVSIVSVDTLTCSRLNSLCNANVILKRRLESGRFYDFTVTVTSSKGSTARLDCSFRATNGTTPINEIFPGAPTLLMVSENARRNTEIGSLKAKGNKFREKSVLLELWGSDLFGLHQRLISDKDAEGTVLLIGRLDYETQTVHHLIILANDPYTEIEKDTRNIASWPLLVAVLDVQDTPPMFVLAPPTTNLDPNLKQGDFILKVKAEDGDRGNPRSIRYGLVSDGNPFTTFFNMSEDTGELMLARPLSELLAIIHTDKPILLTVVADEIRSNPQEPAAMSSTVQLALIPPRIKATSPRFGVREYNVYLNENSPSGTILNLDNSFIKVQSGVVVSLELLNNNGTFEISPTVTNGAVNFTIKVRDPTYLDYEVRRTVTCKIAAKEVEDPDNYVTEVPLTVYLNDINDNPPVFKQNEWNGEISEGADIDTTVLRVEAYDVEGNSSEHVRYVGLSGDGSEYFNINENNGIITIKDNSLDAEIRPNLKFFVIAADEDGHGLTSTATIFIDVLDVNDEVPQFEKNPYEFILKPDRRSFTIPAFVTAIDEDKSPPNNEVHYDLVEANDNLTLNEISGELSIVGIWNKKEVSSLRVRAFDGGVPRLWGETEVRIYPPEGYSRRMLFVVSGSNPDKKRTTDILSDLVGQPVRIKEIRPYDGYESDATDISRGSKQKSVVVATINSPTEYVVDEKRINYVLETHRKEEHVVQQASTGGGSLWWLLFLLLFLILLLIIILILCCICEPCPWYIPPRKRKVVSSEIKRLVVHGEGQGKESKSVQVAEWFGRKEAWTPEAILLETEVDSLRRHEMERGSEREEVRRIRLQQHQQQQQQQQVQQMTQEQPRDQFYIREGNADILRLITRGGEQQRPVTLVADHPYIIDSGKDILMRRYIDQQQSEAVRASVLLPNAIHRQNENELLEVSLRQQNALLRQILLERERDIKLETQSLPAGTQTDHHACTQTEPFFLKPPRRKARSDNDASEASDEEKYAKYRRKKRSNRHRGTSPIRRKIRTPIQEESESNLESSDRQHNRTESRYNFGHTKTSMLRKMASDGNRSRSSRSAIRKEVLKEISDSLGHSVHSTTQSVRSTQSNRSDDSLSEYFTEDSLEEFSPRTIKTSSSSRPQRYHSENDLRIDKTDEVLKKSLSQVDVSKIGKRKKYNKSAPRYMEWYDKNKSMENAQRSKRRKSKHDDKIQKQTDDNKRKTMTKNNKVSKRLLSDTKASLAKKVESAQRETNANDSIVEIDNDTSIIINSNNDNNNKNVTRPEHPLLQHSERRFEIPYEDNDSGIALTRPSIAQKKSVFTIAYTDMKTNQLRPESSTSPL